ncbi:type I-E CRISPR-associated protein Cse2/CasB [Limnobaculum parvum]|uniref:Type I-E CRISPR-associated protein Cse2/CasB n=1 Tax=Limnobaculum parvum TaxID=2172103 RepID=A0A2Y9TVK4_9GAMM|nr:type I-E CRISPR-associated protein Cse2/CasB [Limnobaculum parvum]AWH87652.1 type I-E CRISPR-associated protein Cse2/CasB [Limnobaculum parvum]
MSRNDTSEALIFRDKAACQVLNDWFDSLQERGRYDGSPRINGRAWRAQLRRVEFPHGIMVTDGYHHLAHRLNEFMQPKDVHSLSLALFAAVVVHASKNNQDGSFAQQLGAKINDRECVSRLRFDRLLAARTPDELCSRLIRVVKLRGELGINVVSLADGIFLWMQEWLARQENRELELNPFRRNNVRWASEYLLSTPHK